MKPQMVQRAIQGLLAVILLALLSLAAGCAPVVVGKPEETGLVVFQGEIEREGILGLGGTYATTLGEVEGPSGIIRGNGFRKYVVFSNLPPGKYTMRSMGYTVKTGNNVSTTTFRIAQPHVAQVPQLQFEVTTGKPVFVGIFKVYAKRTFTESDLKISYDAQPATEKAAWETMASELKAANKDNPWLPHIEQHLGTLQ